MVNYILDNTIRQIRQGKNVDNTFSVCNHEVIWYSDKIFRIVNYEMPVFYNFNGCGGRRKKSFYDDDDRGSIDMEIRRKTIGQVIKTIYGLSNCNFNNEKSKFLTLVPAENITDVNIANKEFKKFISRVRRIYGNFEYIAVIEFQKTGRVHYHLMINLPYIPQKKLLDLWGAGSGSVYIRKIRNVDNVGAYILKYMGKSIGDERLLGNKAYLCSQGLNRPLKKRFQSEIEFQKFLKEYDVKNLKHTKLNVYQSENYGLIEETEYNLSRI